MQRPPLTWLTVAVVLAVMASFAGSAEFVAAQCAEVDTSLSERPWDLPPGEQQAAILVTIRDVGWLAQHPAFGERFTALLTEHGVSAADIGLVRAGIGQGESPSLTLAVEAASDVNMQGLAQLLAARGMTQWTSPAYPTRNAAGPEDRGCALTHRFSTNEATRLTVSAEQSAPISIIMRTVSSWADLEPALADIVEVRLHVAASLVVEFEVQETALAEATRAELVGALSRLSSVPEVVALDVSALLSSAEVIASDHVVTMTFPANDDVWAPIHALIQDVLESEFE